MAVTVTERTIHSVKLIKFEWESNLAGTATGSTTRAYSGQILKMITIPGAATTAGATASVSVPSESLSEPSGVGPVDNYDIRIKDDTDVDVLDGAGVDRDMANTEQVTPQIANQDGTRNTDAPVDGVLHLTVLRAGALNTGTIWLYIR